MAHEICGLAADWLHALEDLFEGREMFFLILLGDPIGHRKHFAVAGGGKRKADGGRSPLLAVATPGDAFPFQAGGRVARRSRIDSDMLPPTASLARTALPTAHFDRNKIHVISGTGH
jgi:hypothetical protein